MTQGNTLFFLYKRKYNVKFANAVMKEMLEDARQYSETYQ